MNLKTRWFCALPLALLGACSSVYVQAPLGETPELLETATWQGTWVSGEVVLMTTVLDAEAGRLQAAWLERYESGARLERFEGEVRRTGNWLFITMPRPTDPEEAPPEDAADVAQPPEYLWARLTNDGRAVLIWWPNPEAFREAVRDGRLAGVVGEDDDVRLGELTPADLEWINSPASGLLNWSEPTSFVRIGD